MQSKAEKKELILQAAEQLFHRYGYNKTSLDDIAREAGLGKGTIYYYYASKEDIFLEVLQESAEIYYKQLKDVINSEQCFEEKFTAIISRPIKLIYEHAPILVEVIKSLPRHYLSKLDEFRYQNRQRMIDILKEVVDEGIKNGVVEEDTPVERLINILFDWFLLGDSNIIIQYPEEFIKKAEQDYSYLVHLLLYGILKRGKRNETNVN